MDTKRILLGLFVAAAIGTSPVVSIARQGQVGPPQHTYTALTDGQTKLVADALELFNEAGLRLPGIDFVRYEDSATCWNRTGAAVRNGLRTEVRLCSVETGPFAEWVVLHEIAHAWDHHTLGAERRQAFLEIRDAVGWRDGEWHEKGAEQAAEIIVWGLIDRPVKLVRITQHSCDELKAGYVALTGVEPLHGFTDLC